jgi:hypothetical protein
MLQAMPRILRLACHAWVLYLIALDAILQQRVWYVLLAII